MTRDSLQDAVRHVRPRRDEVAIVHHPDGAPAIIHTAAGPREMRPMLAGEPLVAVVPGDHEHLGWVTPVMRYSRLYAVRNGRLAVDRKVWDDAVKVVNRGGVSYLRFERRDYHGRERWTASEVRFHVDNPGYRVAFERIGRNHNPPDLVIDRVGTGDPDAILDRLGEEIARHAVTNGIRSRDVEVLYDPDEMRGQLIVGGLRSAGGFLVVETGADPEKARAALSA